MKKIDVNIKTAQIGRLAGAATCAFLAVSLLIDWVDVQTTQDCMAIIARNFPDEWKSMVEKRHVIE